MAQSKEYPDLKWVSPNSWTNADRTSVQLIVIHDTEGSAHDLSAEDGAAYDQRREDQTSTHYFVDSNSIVQCVLTSDVAHAALYQGNHRGIQYELCARAYWDKGKWLSAAYGLPMLKLAAKQVARDAQKWGIPAVKLTPDQIAAGKKGLCGHGDVTRAFPEDGGDHTDPGGGFPWTEFVNMVKAEMAPAAPPRKVEYMILNVKVPILQQGDRDDQLDGFNMISRIQRLVRVDDDGVWGSATTEAIAKWCKIPTKDAKKLTEEVYRKVFGAGR